MQKSVILFLLLYVFLAPPLLAQKDMDNKKMEKIFKNKSERVDGERGNWQLIYRERILLVLTDQDHNRMRIFTPVVEEQDIDAGIMRKMLSANFHSALDAKYSLYNGFVISTFTHPLKELTAEQLIDAMNQVVTLADNFGTTYSSTELIFGAEEEEKKINKSPSKEKRS